jgi:lipopolysaccharide/colanic/teichoic acid biosynthesis glycosyltransferase
MYRTDSLDGAALDGTQTHRHRAVPRFKASRFQKGLKRLVDIAGAAIFFTLGLPLFVAVAVGVWISSPGPIFYSQLRVGRKGRLFRFWKFRSMLIDSEEVLTSFLDSDSQARQKWDTHQKIENDPRVTRFGRFIRRTSLDELPQFWNVLRGDMSLVGPRPVTSQEEARYGEYWAAYCAVRPGLTGLWQVSGRSRVSYAKRVRMDERYVQDWSLVLDAKILLRTVKVVVTAHGSM